MILKFEERQTSKRISKGTVGSMLSLALLRTLLEGEAALDRLVFALFFAGDLVALCRSVDVSFIAKERKKET